MSTVAGPCPKCGGVDRQACGRCVGCRKAQRRVAAENATRCPKCGGSEIDAWGYCKPCRASRGRRLAEANPACDRCGTADRYRDGRCKRCVRTADANRTARLTACTKCGSSDLTPSGACRMCIRASKERRASRRNEPCAACGSTDKRPTGDCRRCCVKYQRKYQYGVTGEDFERMMQRQRGKCAACKDTLADLPPKHVHVDHDHTTGEVRGVLCQGCNTAIGLLKDSPLRAKLLADYLTRNAPTLPFSRSSGE